MPVACRLKMIQYMWHMAQVVVVVFNRSSELLTYPFYWALVALHTVVYQAFENPWHLPIQGLSNFLVFVSPKMRNVKEVRRKNADKLGPGC